MTTNDPGSRIMARFVFGLITAANGFSGSGVIEGLNPLLSIDESRE